MKATRAHKYRQIVSAQIGTNEDDATIVTAWVTGGHSLLRFAIYVAFFPTTSEPGAGDFANNTFDVYPWIIGPEGKRARASYTPINDGGTQQAPGGWEGSSSIDEYQVTTTFSAVADAGEWRIVVVVEPADGCAVELFDELAARVQVHVD